MFKEEIIKFIEEIDEQLKKNKEVIDAYEGEWKHQFVPADEEIAQLCNLSTMLIAAREMWQNMLLDHYGVYYMREL